MKNLLKNLLKVLGLVAIIATFGVSCDTGMGTSAKSDDAKSDDKTYYTVTFMNGSSVYQTQSVEEGQAITLPVNPVYNDCEFIGWGSILDTYVESDYGLVRQEITIDSDTVVNQDITVKAKYQYNKYEVIEGTFVSNHDGSYNDRSLYLNAYHFRYDSSDSVIHIMERLSTAEVPVQPPFIGYDDEKHYETYNYYGFDTSQILEEVRGKDGVEFEYRNGNNSFGLIFNYEGPEQTGTALRDWNKPLAGYTWIVVKPVGTWLTGYMED
jgi:hypothetical protein